jgi:Fur family iron response transcriptional regulator
MTDARMTPEQSKIPSGEGREQPRRPISESTVKSLLAEKGIRPTRPRVQLGQLILGGCDRHFTAETIYEEAAIFRPRPVLATVYNTLREFAEHGLLREVAVYGNRLWFDTKTGPHFHFYLDGQEELFDIPDESIPDIQFSPPPGMRIAGIDVVVRLEPLKNTD